MKKFFILILFATHCCLGQLFAQNKFSLKVNAGVNTTLMSDFDNTIYAGTLRVPGLYLIDDFSNSPVIYSATSETKNKISYFGEIEGIYNLQNNYALSLSLGINKLSYDYKTYHMTGEDTGPYGGPIFADTKTYFDFPEEYGNTDLTYLHSNFLNVQKQWNKFTLQAGPAMSFLIAQNYKNGVVKTENGNQVSYVEHKNKDAEKLLYGANINLRYNILSKVDAILGARYMFNSVYQKENTSEEIYKSSKPFVLSLGLSYQIL